MNDENDNHQTPIIFHLPTVVYNVAYQASGMNVANTRFIIFNFWEKILQTNHEDQILRAIFLLKQMSNRLFIDIDLSNNLGQDTADGYRKALGNLQFFANPRNVNHDFESARKSRITEANLVRLQAMRDFFGSNVLTSQISLGAVEYCVNEIDETIRHVADNVRDLYISRYLHDELQFLKFCLKNFHYLGLLAINETAGKLVTNITSEKQNLHQNTVKKIGGVAFLLISLVSTYGPFKSGVTEILGDMKDVLDLGSVVYSNLDDQDSIAIGERQRVSDGDSAPDSQARQLPGPENGE
mgnify:CR=1 FL=1